jgi:hypothetical protein
MRHVGRLGALSLLCLLGSASAFAQDKVCGDQVCGGKLASAPIERAPAAASSGQTDRCPAVPIEVKASSADEHRLACLAGRDALQLLGRCGIAPKRVLRLEILSEVSRPFSGPIFGMFDIAHERVLLTREANIPRLIEDTPYAGLPPRDFYKSLVVHEIVHGVMHQNLTRKVTTHAAYEYPAYALQLESLPADVRDVFLRSFDQTALKSNTLFNDSVLFFDPYIFAARAYHHYANAPDACANITNLLKGEVVFIAPPT